MTLFTPTASCQPTRLIKPTALALALITSLNLMILNAQAGQTQYVNTGNNAYADAVLVKESVLAHSNMILPVDQQGQITAVSFSEQFEQLQKNIKLIQEGTIGTNDFDFRHLVRVNWYVAKQSDLKELETLRGEVNYALTTVVTPLPNPKALLGVDLVFTTNIKTTKVTHLKCEVPGVRISLMPQGKAVYISGQLEKGDGVVDTARKTLEGLHKTLKQIGLEASHVVSIKTFLDPMYKVAKVDEVISSFYPSDKTPAVTHVEWKSKDTIEIEMVAYLPADVQVEGADDSKSVQHFWLDWLSVSPVYCRYTLINTDSRIYISEILSNDQLGYEEEIHALFAELKRRLAHFNSDLNHLAKATYYVSDEGVSGPFGKLRHDYYDPKHPPAASKATVESLGNPDRTILIDMIAAPVK